MKIANIFAIAKMNESFDLEILSSKLDNTEFNTNKTLLKMRLKPKNNYVAFYASGKFLITGVNTFKDLEDVLKRVLLLLKSIDTHNEFDSLDVANIVCTDELGFTVSLENIIELLNSSLASYEPEVYHGLHYKDDDGVLFTLYSSGKIIMTGLKDYEITESKIKDFKMLIKNLIK